MDVDVELADHGLRCIAVVLNYNNTRFTSVAVRALTGQSQPPERVVVVDNGSSDDQLSELRAELAGDIVVIELPENRGIPGGLAPGIQWGLHRGADTILIVLNDTELERDALALLQGRLVAEPRLGAVAPLQVRFDDPEVVVTSGSRLDKVTWLVSAHDGGRSRREVQSAGARRPDYLDFTCLLVRSQVLREVGLPWEGFRFYWDDAEWGLRVRRAGWHLGVAVDAVVRHRVSGTLSASKGSVATYYQYRNRLVAKRRLDGRLGVARLLAQEPLLLAARALVRRGDGGGTRLQARAAIDFLRRGAYPSL